MSNKLQGAVFLMTYFGYGITRPGELKNQAYSSIACIVGCKFGAKTLCPRVGDTTKWHFGTGTMMMKIDETHS